MNATVAATVELDGVEVRTGDPVRVDGLRGSWTFRGHVSTDNSEWLDVYGGTFGHEKQRAFRRERVHPLKKTRRR